MEDEFQKTRIPKFRRFVLQNFPFIEQDFDALTDYALICKVIEYLNKVIESTNATSEQMEVLTNAFEQLKDYVDHYFENLDVQEEINNKLDEMAEDGTLEEIMASYLQTKAVFAFDTLADLKNATNLIDGSYARTIGYSSVNDGGGCIYKIRTRTESDKPNDSTLVAIGDNLVGVLVYTEDYLPLTFEYVRYSGSAPVATNVWYSIIPNTFKPEFFIANGTVGTTEEPSHNAMQNMTTLSINAGFTTGIIVKDGILRQEQLAEGDERFDDIYMTNDGTLNSVDSFTSTEDILELNPNWAFMAWKPIVKDGVDLSGELGTDYNPRTFIGQDSEGNYIVGVCDGRTYESYGLNMADIKNFVESVGFTPYFLFNLDGGGSSCMVYKGQRVNRLVNYENRSLPNFLGFKSKFAKNKSVFESNYVTSINNIRQETAFQPQNLQFMSERIEVPEESSSIVTLNSNSLFYIIGNLAILHLKFTISSATLGTYKPILTGLPRVRINASDITVHKVYDGSSYHVYMTQNDDGITSTLRNYGNSALPAGDYYVDIIYPFATTNGGISLS